MPPFTNAEQIASFLQDGGFQQASTGGGFSAWILDGFSPAGNWQIVVSDELDDSADIRPQRAIVIQLFFTDGVYEGESKCEVIEGANDLPNTLDMLRKFTAEKSGTTPLT